MKKKSPYDLNLTLNSVISICCLIVISFMLYEIMLNVLYVNGKYCLCARRRSSSARVQSCLLPGCSWRSYKIMKQSSLVALSSSQSAMDILTLYSLLDILRDKQRFIYFYVTFFGKNRVLICMGSGKNT